MIPGIKTDDIVIQILDNLCKIRTEEDYKKMIEDGYSIELQLFLVRLDNIRIEAYLTLLRIIDKPIFDVVINRLLTAYLK